MAEGWANWARSDLNNKYPKDTNVGICITSHNISYNGYQIINKDVKIGNDTYYVRGYSLSSGSKPDVSSSQFESHCRMASYGCCIV